MLLKHKKTLRDVRVGIMLMENECVPHAGTSCIGNTKYNFLLRSQTKANHYWAAAGLQCPSHPSGYSPAAPAYNFISMATILKSEQMTQEIQDEIDAVKAQFSELLVTQEQAVTRLGRALQKPLAETPEKICAHIKFILKEAIEKGAITERRIEQLCPDEWKNSSKAEAGRAGAEKSAAKQRQKMRTDGSTESESTESLQGQINELRGQLESMKPVSDALRTISDKAKELDGVCTCETCEMARQLKVA